METYQNLRIKKFTAFLQENTKKKESKMPELIGTVIIRAQQSLESAAGLNSVEIEIDDEIIIKKLKKIKKREV